jgi:gliding motility-associated-like protein
MFGSDGIAVINNYLATGDTDYILQMEQMMNPAPPLSSIISIIFPHAYTTPCDTFLTSIIADTSVCLGDSLQLFASGGNGYEWVNPLGMDNPTLAQPKVAPDSAFRYVVRIENEPGCTRTESVFVEVLPKPNVDSVSLFAEVCGNENGQLNVWTSGNENFTYSLGALSQSNPTFSNLVSGEYNLSVTDSKGCSLDSIVFVPLTIEVEASFSASPESGGKPLDVEFTNTSQNATNYEWYIDSLFWDDTEHTAAYFDSIGEYPVQLFAFNKRPECVDSTTFTILVFETIYARIPNVFTPNNDGVNDVFTIDVRGASEVNASFFNRWGNEMHALQTSSSGFEQTIPLWDGTTLENQSVIDGTYFYTISITSIAGNVFDFQGHVQVVNE